MLFLSEVAGVPKEKKKLIPLAYGMVLVWFLFGFGPFAVIGNTFFSDPSNPSSWAPFNLPSIWVWQIVFFTFWNFRYVVSSFLYGFFTTYFSR